MKREFEILSVTRTNVLRIFESFSEEQLLKIPNGFNNNILWNTGHIVNSSHKLTYGMAGLQLPVPEHFGGYYAKGTRPSEWKDTPDYREVKEQLMASWMRLKEDYEKGLFVEYKEYPTSYGYPLRTIEDAITFNNTHEGLHLGVIMSLKKLV